MNRGFTLIELLVAVAIIGVLAAVSVPGLVQARSVARDRAAESYAHGVYKAAYAYLAHDTSALTSNVDAPCGAGTIYDPGGIGLYVVPDPGGSVQDCDVAVIGDTFVVQVTSPTGVTVTLP